MGAAVDFEEEKLIIGVIYHDPEVLERAMAILVEEFGETDGMCEEFSFSNEFSSYYDGELGGEGLRRIVSFEKTVDASYQADIKLFTNEVELRFADEAGRKVNIDPGFISHGRVMLATTKGTGFRIPLKDGIYTELTLYYARGEWQKLPWTYRDYQSPRVQEFLTKVRKKYLEQRKNSKD
jgi:hypothetical protein